MAREVIRFHKRCKFGIDWHPAMVCLVRNILSDEPQAIQRTALNPDGTKIKRDGKTLRMLAPIGGGAIKFDPDEDVEQGLCISEGVETCLAGRQKGLRPAWCAVGTAGVANFPVLPGVNSLHVHRENDDNGARAKAVEACCRRWYDAGRDAIIVDPEERFGDLNDEIMEVAR